MLKIYFQGIDAPAEGVELNPERAFSMIKNYGDDIDKHLIKSIDGGTFLDQSRFLDRFGVALYRDQLSTGCKAAIAVHHNPHLVISCVEVGYNAVKQILLNCNEGSIILKPSVYCIEKGSGPRGRFFWAASVTSRYTLTETKGTVSL